jgi:HK97 family phage prohead protease/HK97 family phage major capsid protein
MSNAAAVVLDTPQSIDFRVNLEKRTISGLAVPWGVVAMSRGRKYRFAQGSLHWSDEGRVKLNRDHDSSQAIGKAVRLQDLPAGLDASFKIGRGAEGDKALMLAEDGIADGFSIEIDFEDGDIAEQDPSDPAVTLVRRATLRGVALTAMPAFDNARVSAVAASRDKEMKMTETVTDTPAPDLTAFTAGLADSIGSAVEKAFEKLTIPQPRQPVDQTRAMVTYEPPVYDLVQSRNGASFVRDWWRARTEGDADALARIQKFQAQQADCVAKVNSLAFTTGTTSNLAGVIPPGYRPELYVPMLAQGRPLFESVSRGAISDATPFTVPKFVSQTGLAATHVEGTNPTDGTVTVGTITVTPGAKSGLFKVTREIVDSSNPAIDAIGLQAMREAYAQLTEAVVYAELNGANGVGGTITGENVPSGAYAYTSTGAGAPAAGKALLAKYRETAAKYPFRRFASLNRIVLSQEGTVGFASAEDSTGRPLLPYLNPSNSVGAQSGLGTPVQGFNVDGLAAIPAWSMTGNAAGDADLIGFNSADAWAWESPTLMFRFEERNGPAVIDLALFGYFACRILRPGGFFGVRGTQT